MEDEKFDVVIVGSGPAGLTAAIYAQRLGMNSVVMGDTPGGNLYMIENLWNYPGFPGGVPGAQLGAQMFAQAQMEGATLPMIRLAALSTEDGVFFSKTATGERYESRTAVLATGVVPKSLHVKGEEKLGIHYCALCDGPLFRGKDANVVVVGGGNMAAHEALILSHFADHIQMIHRRGELRAEAALQRELRNRGNVEMIMDAQVQEVLGDDTASGVRIATRECGEQVLRADGIFVCVGWEPDLRVIGAPFDTTAEGYVKTDASLMSSHPGLFAAGDVRDTAIRQVVTACSDGALAATSAYEYLNRLDR